MLCLLSFLHDLSELFPTKLNLALAADMLLFRPPVDSAPAERERTESSAVPLYDDLDIGVEYFNSFCELQLYLVRRHFLFLRHLGKNHSIARSLLAVLGQ